MFSAPLGSWRNDLLTATLNVIIPCGTPIIREELGQNFFTGKIALFFKNLCFQQPPGSWRNGLITSTLIVKLPWTPIIVPWRLCCFKIREEIGEKLFFTGKFSSFFKSLCFQQPLGSWRNDPLTSTLIVKLPCGTPISCSLTFVLFYNTRKVGENLFFTGKFAFFFKNLCFQQPLGSWRNDLLTSTLNVWLPCGTPIIVPWRLCCFKIREEIGEKLSSLESFPLSSKVYVFSNLLGPEEMIL